MSSERHPSHAAPIASANFPGTSHQAQGRLWGPGAQDDDHDQCYPSGQARQKQMPASQETGQRQSRQENCADAHQPSARLPQGPRVADQIAQLQSVGSQHQQHRRLGKERMPSHDGLHHQDAHHRRRGEQQERAFAVSVGDDDAQANHQHLRAGKSTQGNQFFGGDVRCRHRPSPLGPVTARREPAGCLTVRS